MALGYDYVVRAGLRHRITDEERCALVTGESFSSVFHIPYAHGVDKESKYTDKDYQRILLRIDEFCDSYYLLSDTGDTLPIYQYVPCGHCELCQSIKMSSLLQRCHFAFLESRFPAVFATLTFNPNAYKDDIDFLKRQFVLFKKRFRTSLVQLCDGYESNINLKFISSCERGKLGRCHFHVVILGIPLFKIGNEVYARDLITQLIQYCWRSNEIVQSRPIRYMSFDMYRRRYPRIYKRDADYDPLSFGFVNVSVCNNVRSSMKYVFKYLFKGDNDMLLWKSLSVNLGLSFATELSQQVLQSRDGSFKMLDGNKVTESYFCSYYIRKLFPSDSKLLPLSIRRSFINLMYSTQQLLSAKFLDTKLKDEYPNIKRDCLAVRTLANTLYPFLSYFYTSKDTVKNDFFDGIHLNEFPNLPLALKLSERQFVENHIEIISNSMFELCTSDFIYEDFLEKSYRSAVFFSKMANRKPLSYSEKVDIANRFTKELKSLQSKSHLIN